MKPLAKLLDHDRIAEAIRRAEAGTTGEMRVHITPTRAVQVQREAEATFERLGMTATKQRNAVLLYIAPRSRQFAVVGDAGIQERCGDRLWGPVAAAVEWEFRSGRFTEGIVEAVRRVGAALAEHFPLEQGVGNPNELPDTVSDD